VIFFVHSTGILRRIGTKHEISVRKSRENSLEKNLSIVISFVVTDYCLIGALSNSRNKQGGVAALSPSLLDNFTTGTPNLLTLFSLIGDGFQPCSWDYFANETYMMLCCCAHTRVQRAQHPHARPAFALSRGL
jgi:hypothetical protein